MASLKTKKEEEDLMSSLAPMAATMITGSAWVRQTMAGLRNASPGARSAAAAVPACHGAVPGAGQGHDAAVEDVTRGGKGCDASWKLLESDWKSWVEIRRMPAKSWTPKNCEVLSFRIRFFPG